MKRGTTGRAPGAYEWSFPIRPQMVSCFSGIHGARSYPVIRPEPFRISPYSPEFVGGFSPKSGCRIVHIPAPIGSETANRPDPAPGTNPYMFWWGIKMRGYEWEAVRRTPRMRKCAGQRIVHQLQYRW